VIKAEEYFAVNRETYVDRYSANGQKYVYIYADKNKKEIKGSSGFNVNGQTYVDQYFANGQKYVDI
jgi:hypothetical protein